MRSGKTLVIAAAMTSLGIVVGCANKGTDPKATTSYLDERTGEARKFEKSGDPPFTVETRYAAGQLAESQDNLPAAVSQYKEALKIQKDHAPSLYRLGVLYTRAKAFPEAIEAWNAYVRATKGSATAYANLGFCYDLAGKPADARAAFEKGIAREPSNKSVRINYGLMLARQGQMEQATIQLKQVLPEAQVHYNLASVYEGQGKLEPARQEYLKALAAEPAFTDARIRLAKLGEKAAAGSTAASTAEPQH